MSLPMFPKDPTDLSRDDVINQILSSIAMEELALSHILNAEGEKMQYILGTLPGVTGPNPTVEEVLEANDSVRKLLEAASYNQMFLKGKMTEALSASCKKGETPPPPPEESKTVDAIQLQFNKPNTTMNAGAVFLFDNVANSVGDITYNDLTGEITLQNAGTYYISWEVMIVSAVGEAIVINLESSQGDVIPSANGQRAGQISGSGIIITYEPGVSVKLVNISSTIMLAGEPVQANLTVYSAK